MADDEAPERPTLQSVDEWTGGFSWIADPDERGQRASHALATEAGVWIVDPVDTDGLDERVAELGEVAGVLVLHDRHTRDAEAVARRHDVAVHVPDWMTLVLDKLETAPESVGSELPGTNYTVHRLVDTDEWEEAVLVDETTATLIVPEALGTLESFREGDNALGVHPGVDDPPHSLADWQPERLLVRHGPSIYSEADAKLKAALEAE
jgi:hypothetical protein